MNTRFFLLPLLGAFALTGCATDADQFGAVEAEPELYAAGNTKVDVCHWSDDAGSFSVINISEKAVDKHLDNHGDHLADTFYADADGDGFGDAGDTADCLNDGYVENSDDCDDADAGTNPAADDICGDGIDNNCDGDVDEECVTCPCLGDYVLPTFSNGQCYSDYENTGAYTDLHYIYTDSFLVYSLDWDTTYEDTYGYSDFMCVYSDYTTGDFVNEDITADEHAACSDEIDALSADYGLICY